MLYENVPKNNDNNVLIHAPLVKLRSLTTAKIDYTETAFVKRLRLDVIF